MATCRVCWNCYGLFKDQKECGYKVKSHLKYCTGTTKSAKCSYHFEYFVCNKKDFRVLTDLKKNLSRCGRYLLSNINVQKVLPNNILRCLIALSDNISPGPCEHQDFLRSDDKSVNELNKELLRGNSDKCLGVKFDKSCQTQDQNIYVEQQVDKNPVSISLCDNFNQFGNRDNVSQTQPALSLCDSKRVTEVYINGNSVRTVTTIDLSKVNQSSHRDYTTIPDVLSLKETTFQGKVLLASEEEKLKAQCSLQKVNKESFFTCKLCYHKTKSDRLMLRHLSCHNEGQPFECKSCAFSTIWGREWKQHLVSHEKHKISCHICLCEFWKKEKLDRHIASVHPDLAEKMETDKLCCRECNYVAKSVTALREHNRKHTGEVFICTHTGCEFKSVYERSLQKHLKQKHAQEKTQTCWVCGFQTRHSSSLSKHMLLVHQEFKPYKCGQCPFKALYPSEVITHTKSKHLKQKRFSCPICSFQTSYPLAIQKHVERHMGAGGIFCFLCGEGFDSSVLVKKHLEQKHNFTDYGVVSESAGGKPKPNDYKIETNGNRRIIDNTYHVMVVKPDVVELEKSTDDANVATSTILDISSNILDAPLDSEPVSAENILSKSLDQEINMYSTNTRKRGNPMLSATTKDLGDMDSSLIEDSLFDLMSDFPRPPGLNRSQSASTVMFASFSPHLIDRPMTPDFFTDSPSVGSFFPNYSTKNLDPESLSLGNLTNFDAPSLTLSVPPSNIGLLASSTSVRGVNPTSPVLPSFITSSEVGSVRSLGSVSLPTSLIKENHIGMDVESLLPNAVLSGLSQLGSCAAGGPDCAEIRLAGVPFISTNSAFTTLNSEISPDQQVAAVALIPSSVEADCATEPDCAMVEESPFPAHVL